MKRNKGGHIKKEKLSLFRYDVISYVEYPKVYTWTHTHKTTDRTNM